MENDILNRHASRFIAIMALYSNDVQEAPLTKLEKNAKAIEESYLAKDIFDIDPNVDIKLYNPDSQFLERLIRLRIERAEDIDTLIEDSLIEKWKLNKIDKVIKAILQLAALELIVFGDIHAKIIIDEYVNLTKSFYDNSETGFVNKIIDTMAKKVRTEI